MGVFSSENRTVLERCSGFETKRNFKHRRISKKPRKETTLSIALDDTANLSPPKGTYVFVDSDSD
jgi:hypothetical protein